jgi:hypothetical protein
VEQQVDQLEGLQADQLAGQQADQQEEAKLFK